LYIFWAFLNDLMYGRRQAVRDSGSSMVNAANNIEDDNGETECSICLGSRIVNPIELLCSHKFCCIYYIEFLKFVQRNAY